MEKFNNPRFVYDVFGIDTADFYNIDLANDNRKFIDPYYLATLSHPEAVKANNCIVNFFETVRESLASGDYDNARETFCNNLTEPKETCLGMSYSGVYGKGLKELAEYALKTIYDDETLSKTIRHIEDIKLFVPNIGDDRVSDICTNVIREILIDYTYEQCQLYGQPTRKLNNKSYKYWDDSQRLWATGNKEQYVWSDDGLPKLLVPKCFLTNSRYNTTSFFSLSVLPNLIDKELARGESSLIQTRKDGSRYITKKSMRKELQRNIGTLDKINALNFVKQSNYDLDDFRKALGDNVRQRYKK